MEPKKEENKGTKENKKQGIGEKENKRTREQENNSTIY